MRVEFSKYIRPETSISRRMSVMQPQGPRRHCAARLLHWRPGVHVCVANFSLGFGYEHFDRQIGSSTITSCALSRSHSFQRLRVRQWLRLSQSCRRCYHKSAHAAELQAS
jgi:hypothetical protein